MRLPARVAHRVPASVRESRVQLGACGAVVLRPTALGSERRAPALLYVHGGGWALGAADEPAYRGICAQLAAQAQCVVLSVEYRLAPEHAFPAAVDDALGAWRALRRDAARHGVDAQRVAIGGDSAGGNLAAAVCLLARAPRERPCAAVLVYPATFAGARDSHARFGTGFLLDSALQARLAAAYAGDAAIDALRGDTRVHIAGNRDWSGFPPTFVLTAGFDPLVDEGYELFERLRDAGVPARHSCYTDTIHGFLSYRPLRESAVALNEISRVLRALFAIKNEARL